MSIKRILTLSLLFLLSSFSISVLAEQSKTLGDYVIHYNAVNTTMLTPEIARTYGITRSKNSGLLTVAVRKKLPDQTKDISVQGEVIANAVNLTAQMKTIEMRQVSEGDTTYYVGVFSVANEETLNFTIKVRPEFKTEEKEIKFSQQFFAD